MSVIEFVAASIARPNWRIMSKLLASSVALPVPAARRLYGGVERSLRVNYRNSVCISDALVLKSRASRSHRQT